MHDDNPAPQADAPRKPSGFAIPAIIAGLLITALSGLCTGSALISGGASDTGGYGPLIVIFAIIIGAPVIALGLGLVAFGQRLGDDTVGSPPLWHVIIGWVLMIMSGLVILAVVAGAVTSVVSMASMGYGPSGSGEGAAGVSMMIAMGLMSALPPLVVAGLAFWLGRALTRPRR